MPDLTKLPLSVTSFRDFAANALIYVDKTDLVADLARFRNPFFLSRPRRFGKSTLVSTFHEFSQTVLINFKVLKLSPTIYGAIRPIKSFISIFPKLKRI
ncbi:AAA family ATPase, partial [Succinatimonas hippei]|uniref:AAA family ATPase n=1 Tax=Succinatimonas hippei TaxID=626938 RepID=UPI0009FC0A5D